MIIGLATWYHGMTLTEQGDHVSGLAYLERALAIVQPLHYLALEAAIEAAMGFIAWRLDNLVGAYSHLCKALQTFVGLDRWGVNVARCCDGLAAVAAARRQEERAVRLLAIADFYYGDYVLEPFRRQERDRVWPQPGLRLAPAAFDRALAAGRRLAEDKRELLLPFVLAPAPAAPPPPALDLTPRQLEVLRLVARGSAMRRSPTSWSSANVPSTTTWSPSTRSWALTPVPPPPSSPSNTVSSSPEPTERSSADSADKLPHPFDLSGYD
jgi:hypothetical protein